MKKMKILLTLFAVVLLAGCHGGSDSPLDVTDMAGTYSFTKVTVVQSGLTTTVVPPDISGSLSITATNRYALDIYIRASRITDSGAVSVSDPNITLVSDGGGSMNGTISDGGRKVTFTGVSGGATLTMEFTKV